VIRQKWFFGSLSREEECVGLGASAGSINLAIKKMPAGAGFFCPCGSPAEAGRHSLSSMGVYARFSGPT
jgi:hypothetical protein